MQFCCQHITYISNKQLNNHSQVLLCALLGSATSKPVAEADLRFARSAEAEAESKAEADADALRPFAYSSPAGAVSFSLGAVSKMTVPIIWGI